jgi:hypothetical protein
MEMPVEAANWPGGKKGAILFNVGLDARDPGGRGSR